MSYWIKIYRIAWCVLALIALVTLVFLFLPKVRKYRELQGERVEKREQNSEKKEAIQDLRTKQEKFRNDPGFIEHTARGIGMAKSDETIFRFTNSGAASADD